MQPPALFLSLLPVPLPPALPQGALCCAWGCRTVPQGWLSLPALVDCHNDSLRAEVAAWAFAYGISPICLHGQSKTVAEWLIGKGHKGKPEPLSAWWTSLLYERHPAMTNFLHTLCCLRMLEQYMEAQAVQHVLLGTLPAPIQRLVLHFCHDTGRRCTLLPCSQEKPQPSEQACAEGAFAAGKAPAANADTAFASASAKACAFAPDAVKANISTTAINAGSPSGKVPAPAPVSTSEAALANAPTFAPMPAPARGREGLWNCGRLRAGLLQIYACLPAPVQALLRFCHWLVQVRRHFPLMPPPAQKQTAADSSPLLLVSYFPAYSAAAAAQGHFRSPYWGALHDVLDQQGRPQQHLFIRATAPHESLAQAVQRCRQWNMQAQAGSGFHYLEEFLPPSAVLAACRRFIGLAFRAAQLKKHCAKRCVLPHSRLNFWALARADYAQSFMGWRGLERCLQAEACARYITWLGQPAVALFPLENCPWERMLIHALRTINPQKPCAAQAPSAHTHNEDGQAGFTNHEGSTPRAAGRRILGAQHSTLRPTDWRYFDDPRFFTHPATRDLAPDSLVTNGAHAVQQLLHAGLPASLLASAEALRFQQQASPAQSQKRTPPCAEAQSQVQAQPLIYEPIAIHAQAQERIQPQAPAWGQLFAKQGAPCQPAAMPAQQALPPARVLLLLTSFFMQESQAHCLVLGQAMRLGLVQHCRIICKSHPWLDARPLLLAACPPALHSRLEFTTSPLPQLFAQAQKAARAARGSALVWCSNSTSAVVDAALAALPLLVHLPPTGFNLCPLAALPQLPYASTVHELGTALRQPRRIHLPQGWLNSHAGTAQWQTLLHEAEKT